MTQRKDEGEQLAPRDARFVQRVAEGFAPPPRSDAQQRAFRQGLDERLRRPRRMTLGLPALAAAGAMALAAVVLLRGLPGPAPETPLPVAAGTTEAAEVPTTSRLVILPEEILVGTTAEGGAVDTLPDDYAAIGDVLLGS